ncbi:GAF domain-containing protein [Nodosilinea sp. P-1105]|uniref:GAF domain-containing protein n=1 Tax=Nodosilinea sp. P-1105 TaxID=2546229 RepID=UPI00146E55CC|nr:GAF domain-containing protein [Nodosilinea sp. P-1105]NMF82554.1 GAF domain-containing protein [Nodosilinea sp. P-1105]
MANNTSHLLNQEIDGQETAIAAMPHQDLAPNPDNSSVDDRPTAGQGGDTPYFDIRPASPGAADWLDLIRRDSHVAIAVIHLQTTLGVSTTAQQLLFANQSFCQLTQRHLSPPGQPKSLAQGELLAALSPTDQARLRQRFRRHVLNALLHYHYGVANLVAPRLCHAPLVVSVGDSHGEARQIELHLRTTTSGLRVTDIAPILRDRLTACWSTPPSHDQVTAQLLTQDSDLSLILRGLNPSNYSAEGYVLVEGVDVTQRETSKALTHLLVGREPVLGSDQFGRANQLLKHLFKADDSLLLSAEHSQAQLFLDLDQPEWTTKSYAVDDLQASVFFRATQRGDVLNVPDLSLHCATPCEQDVLKTGARSLLLIPLAMRSGLLGNSPTQMIGLVGLTSTQPYAFDTADCSNATTLIPALTATMRHSVRERFTNIHPSVRWRFEQEAERLSLGLPPAPIVFENVYPLYGISDIRGSSDERNRAIQQDLLTQFNLALAVVKTVQQVLNNALIQQLSLDLADHLTNLEEGISVDSEVSLLRYLQAEVERHFAYFADLSPAIHQAIDTYQAAIDPDHACVYRARAMYDQTINQINGCLRDTWNQWQQTMQAITPHYCDVEATDGIDHMIYAGRSIDPGFTEFQLKSLRYEQLRAVCDCARKGFDLKATYHTTMDITHLVLVQGFTVDICHDETTERLFDVRGTRDTRYEIVKKRIDKACDAETGDRITQPGKLTVVYSTVEEWQEYQRYFRYLHREGLVSNPIEHGAVEPLQGVSGLKFARVPVLAASPD